jgi:glycosyltransferase involved in cell wall biosynthesis
MANLPTVSVVIPCYNLGRYLGDALQSLQQQTFKDFEIIVVDDGSTDAESLSALARLEPQITQLIRTSNQGVIHARNTGIAEARGRYILPLDADDKIGTTYLEQAVAQLEANPALGIVYCKAEFFGDKSGPWELPPYHFPEILIGNVIFNAGLFRRADWETVGGYNPNMHEGWEDFDFWLSLIELGREVLQLPDTLFYYRIRHNSRNAAMEQEQARFIRAHARIYFNHKALYEKHMDAVFSEIVRLWGVVAQHQGEAQRLGTALQTLQTQHDKLAAEHQSLLSKKASP